ncbi:MAG: amino acid adenylation domain-containing protein [Nostocaceae cyanobacterium]|nr:amino acid adenylation domain-containing protein [Nostocaceae cyanobacterium]
MTQAAFTNQDFPENGETEVYVFPASFGQKRLWFLDQLEPGSPFYNLPFAVRLKGNLNIPILEKSFQTIVERHEALRTALITVNGEPVQAIAPEIKLTIPVVDLEGFPESERENQALQIATQEAQSPFVLSEFPLVRVKLLRLQEQEHILLLSVHHTVFDGWSIGILLKELAAVYTAFSTGQAVILPDLPLQYADYSMWQQEWLQGEVLEKQLGYWQQQLADISPLQLPTDKPRPASQTYEGETYSWQIPPDLTTALEGLSQRAGVTLFMTLLAAFNSLLYRYTGHDDIVVGSAIANRTWAESEGIIGLFVNTLALRTQIDGNPSFEELLGRVRDTTLAAYAHQDLPFEKLVGELQIERDLGRNPLFQVWFALDNVPMSTLQIGDLVLTPIKVKKRTSQFDLSLDISVGEQGLTGEIEYSTELFTSTTITRMVEHFHTLLYGIVANPQAKLSELPLLSAEEKRLLSEWNHTQTKYVESLTIHGQFEAQVAKTPDAIAVICAGESLTYQQLDYKANQLANYLQQLGVGGQTLVGICLERSLEAIIGILGTLKAGGAYVPLDSDYPQERLEFMLQDAQVEILLTRESLVKRLPATNAGVVCLDTDWKTIAACNDEYIPHNSSLAYVIYTSGSTGEPKGVCCQHLGVLNLLTDFERRQPLRVGDNCSLWTSFSFDVSVYEIFSPLLVGATLDIVPQEIRVDSQGFIQWLHSHKITSAYIPPFMLPILANWLEQKSQKLVLRRLLVGVEPIAEQTLIAISDRIPGLQIINGYGPTEATICTTLYSLSSHQEHQNHAPIGKPVNNSQIYLLDQYLQPVPIGIPGEIYIGGVGLAQGYLNRPQLTREKFISNPFTPSISPRLYKTGDVARYLPDGNLEFIGRKDNQIKMRGFRIELGEIESVIKQHPAVQNSVVVAREDMSNNKQLIAYIVPQNYRLENFETEYVSDLKLLYDQFYSWQFSPQDPFINLRVWTSRYTNQPLPEAEIIECVENTVGRILTLQPQRVLEIGCGTGLILSRVAPHCQHYCGVDISHTALEYLQQLLKKRQPELLSKVSLVQGLADNLSSIDTASFDVIILNEIIQNFPSIDYLVRVIENAVTLLKPGGCIFIGGVRSLPLLPAFHAGVQLHGAEPELNLIELKQRIKESLQTENELVIAPNFFTALQQYLPQIGDVQIELKGGSHHNELTKFKYDVILRLGHQINNIENQPWLNWQQQELTINSVQQLLQNNQSHAPLKIANIPNIRIVRELKTLELLETANEVTTVEQLRATLDNLTETGIDPECFREIANLLNYQVKITWSEDSNHGDYNVVFFKHSLADNQGDNNQQKFVNHSSTPTSWSTYANQPLQQKQELQLISQMRNFTQNKLPEYMVPQFFVFLPTLPLTANGKIDTKALPVPEKTGNSTEREFAAPRTNTEEKIANIWTQILGLEAVSIDDNFFELGGHSLLATQVSSRIRQDLRIELPLQKIFEFPTVAELAIAVETIKQEENKLLVPPILPANRKNPLPLSFAQQRLWFLEQLQPNNTAYNITSAVRILGSLNIPALEASFNQIIQRHEILRTAFVAVEGLPTQTQTQTQVITANWQLSVPIIDLQTLSQPEQEIRVQKIIAQETQKPFDLSQLPLLRVTIIQLNSTENVVIFTTHHIISDGWSMDIIIREIATLYPNFVENKPFTLPQLPIQYADFAVWQRQWLQGELLDKLLTYWQKQLENLSVLKLPTDYPQPITPTYQGSAQPFTLSSTLSQQIKTLSNQQGVTLFMTLQAAFATLMHYYSQQDDIVIGTDVANRNQGETEGLIGFFVNQLVLRTKFDGNPTFSELLDRVREVTLDAYAHQDLPFDKLVEAINPERNLHNTPLFQVKLILQNTPTTALNIPDLTFQTLETETKTATFDLLFDITDTEQGLMGLLKYSTDLFAAKTISQMLKNLEIILSKVVNKPSIKINEIKEILAQTDKQNRLAQEVTYQDSLQQKLGNIRRRSVK